MKRLSEYIHFVHSHHETQEVYGDKNQSTRTPHDPIKYPTVPRRAFFEFNIIHMFFVLLSED